MLILGYVKFYQLDLGALYLKENEGGIKIA